MTFARLLVVLLISLSASALAADIDAGRAKARVCVGCHGVTGISNAPVYPNLAGQKEAYLVSALQAYKSRDRQGGNAAVMWSLAGNLSDDDIRNLAAYFASLEPGR
ncbi:c-type cytochrome [Saccharospirillum mangrovi]|uniref:c-type cytochrome n=1 Tax=Saccharospirillum mangrovi TaxID=2161747 RepID=UPI000D3D11AA|nr:cytochrome c [Saccharospirillum mangrovi]